MMCYAPSHYQNQNEFLKLGSLQKVDITYWHNRIKLQIANLIRSPLPYCISAPYRQHFFMSQIQHHLQCCQSWVRDASLAILNPEKGFIAMQDELGRDKFWRIVGEGFNTSPILPAIATGQILLNINCEAAFATDESGANIYPSFNHNKLKIAHEIIPGFLCGCEQFVWTGGDNPVDFNGECRSVANRYSSDKRNIIVYESRVCGPSEDYLSVGRYSPPNRPFGQEKIREYPCILPLAPDVGFALHSISNDIPINRLQKFTILGFYDDVRKMAWGELVGANIILVCSPDMDEWDYIPKILKICRTYHLGSVSIYPFPIVDVYCFRGTKSIPDEARRMLDERIIDLREYERVTKLLENIQRLSFPAEKFKEFATEYKLDKEDINAIFSDDSNIEFRSWVELDNGDTDNGDRIATRQFFSPSNTTLIYGPSDVGKSWAALDVTIALASGKEWWGLAPSQPAKAFYCDGEIGNDITRRIRQLTMGFDEQSMELLKKNLLVSPFNDSRELFEKKELFLALLRKEKPDILILDNILSLAPHALRGKSDFLFDFLSEFKAMGIAPVIIHHSSKNGDAYLGSVSLGLLSQNIIKLENARIKSS